MPVKIILNTFKHVKKNLLLIATYDKKIEPKYFFLKILLEILKKDDKYGKCSIGLAFK